MRIKLKSALGYRGRFTGVFDRYGSKPAYKGQPIRTVLLRDVKFSDGKPATDHLWFTEGKQFAALAAAPGDMIAFDARVTSYTKGYMGHREDAWDAPPIETDYRLSHPNKFCIVREQSQPLPLFAKIV